MELVDWNLLNGILGAICGGLIFYAIIHNI